MIPGMNNIIKIKFTFFIKILDNNSKFIVYLWRITCIDSSL